jgi:predicted transcriptional regulator
MDGKYFRTYIEQQGINKTQFAEDHSLSRTGLYNLFKTKKFSPDTIAWIEKIFKIKWEDVKRGVNIDVPCTTVSAGNTTDLSARVEVLMISMAELLSATSGENVAVVKRRLEKAAEDLSRLG